MASFSMVISAVPTASGYVEDVEDAMRGVYAARFKPRFWPTSQLIGLEAEAAREREGMAGVEHQGSKNVCQVGKKNDIPLFWFFRVFPGWAGLVIGRSFDEWMD